jgi:hypothetical protein
MVKVSKIKVNYRQGTEENHCGNCDMFNPPADCDLVAGRIRPTALCDKWVRGNATLATRDK